MNVSELDRAHQEFLAIAGQTEFDRPPAGEWAAEQILAHVAAADLSIAAAALAVAAGERPTYDNRSSLDGWNLRRLIDRAGSRAALMSRVQDAGLLFCSVVECLRDDDLDVLIRILIISNDEAVADDVVTLRELIEGIATIHLPRHGQQLRALARPVPASA